MWTRVELKEKAKMAFQKNYWTCVIATFILTLIIGWNTAGSLGSNHSNDLGYDTDYEYVEEYVSFDNGIGFHVGDMVSTAVSAILAVVFGIVSIVMLFLGIFVFNVIQIGGCRFFIENAYENPGVGKLLFGFKSGYYGKMVMTMFLKNLYTGLWTILFVIPGIVKAYEYRMIPYLLADCPDMPREEAFAISKEMMYGNKMEAFILDLSFIGWDILAALSCGILGIFWTAPYQHATNAELFLALKDQYFRKKNTEQVVY